MTASEPALEFEFGQAEVDAGYRHFLDNSPYAARIVRRQQAFGFAMGVLLVALGICIIVMADGTGELVFGLSFAAYGAGYAIDRFWTFPRRFRKSWMRRMKKIGADHSLSARFGKHKLRIVGDTLEAETPIDSSRHPLGKLEKCAVTNTHALLYVDGQNSIVIPRHGVIEGNVDEFLLCVQQGMRNSQPPQESRP